MYTIRPATSKTWAIEVVLRNGKLLSLVGDGTNERELYRAVKGTIQGRDAQRITITRLGG